MMFEIECMSAIFGEADGEYLCGDHMTLGDVAIAPFFERMVVLEHYRDFYVPKEDLKFKNWHKWKEKVLGNEEVRKTLHPRKKLLEVY